METTMSQQRLLLPKIAPDAYNALGGVETYLRNCGLEPLLVHLVKMRASQINGCAYCLDMHSREALHAGETEQRLHLLDAWHESSLYSERERAAPAWTEALTRIAETHAPDKTYKALRVHFNEKEIVDLTMLIGQINLWTRVAIGLRNQHSAAANKAA
jgi:AhpD family alkylhydroperoxidase